VRRTSLHVLVVLGVLIGLLATETVAWGAPAAAQEATREARPEATGSTVAYELPVPGALLRPFEEPSHAYAPGHRGVDLVVRPGDAVHAAAGGEVVFAGHVAGERWVTLQHPDGIRTSYGALATTRVTTGTQVGRGEVIGTATGSHGTDVLRPDAGLHWSARRGATYLDPLTLLDAPLPRPTLVGNGGWVATDHLVTPYEPYAGGSRFGVLATPSPTADRPGYALAPNHHHLVQVPGYGSEGPEEVFDASRAGYGPQDTSVLSYAGCVPTSTGCEPRPYGGQDTDITLDEAALLLDAHLRGLQRAQPHRPVDLVGHSMGGDVALHYLLHHHDPTDLGLPPVRHLFAVGTPFGGSGTGSIARAIGDDAVLGHLVEGVRVVGGAIGIPGAGNVSVASDPVARYGAPVWASRPKRDLDRLGELGVGFVEVAGSRDLVVGRTDAGVAGDAYVLPGGHSSVLTTEAFVETLHRGLSRRELAPVDPRVGWGADAVSDAGRTVATIIDVWPVRSVTRALGAGDAAGVLWETATELIGGPSRRRGDAAGADALPLAPDLPRTPDERRS
jgi:pimeloyl-ACP methyl ester carboxylesterase